MLIRMRKRENYTILTPEIVTKISEIKPGAPELYLSSQTIFPPGYMEYLTEVLRVNQHLPVFSGEVCGTIGNIEVWRVVKEQIREVCRANVENVCEVQEVRQNGEVVGVVVRGK